MPKKKEEELKLIKLALGFLSRWKPLPESLIEKLPLDTLKELANLAAMMRARGLADKRYKPPERLKLMQKLIEQLTRQVKESPDPVESMPEPAKSEQKAAESQLIREADAETMRTQRQDLGRIRRGRDV